MRAFQHSTPHQTGQPDTTKQKKLPPLSLLRFASRCPPFADRKRTAGQLRCATCRHADRPRVLLWHRLIESLFSTTLFLKRRCSTVNLTESVVLLRLKLWPWAVDFMESMKRTKSVRRQSRLHNAVQKETRQDCPQPLVSKVRLRVKPRSDPERRSS
jgi:hypothetical protein